MTTQTDFINNVPDGKPVRIFLPLQAADKRHREQCIFQKSAGPRFKLLFKTGALPANDIDTKLPCIINLDMAGRSVSIEAMIEQVASDQILEMIVLKTITHKQMREYFRADYTLPIITSSQIPEGFGPPEEYWKILGTTIDISGNGLLAIFNERPPTDKLTKIELPLPHDQQTSSISFLARPVRTSEVEENRYVVAYQYEEISDEDRDKIVGQCLALQRRLLRLKVQIKE